MKAVLVAAALAVSVLPAVPAQAAACTDVFPASFRAQLARDFPGQRVTAAVYDTRTRCWHHLNPGMRITTASVLKAGILGATLLRAQDAGRGPSSWESARLSPMVRLSHNPPTNELYGHVGGVSGMNSFDRRMGATATTNTSTWGLTVTTAADRTLVAARLLHGGGPLAAAGRSTAWSYMGSTNVTQRWGITAGVPAGFPVAQKNGFYPSSGKAAWRVGSTGMVRRQGSPDGWAVTVMSDQNPSMPRGITLVETVSRRIASALYGAPAADPRPVTRAVCTTTRSGESWTTVAGRVGEPASRAAYVRSVSGGNPSPLQGQRACAQHLRS